MAANDGAGEGGGDVHGPAAGFGEVHALVVAAEQDERGLLLDQRTDRLVVGLLARLARDGEVAGQAHLLAKEILEAAGIGFGRDDGEAGGAEEVLGDGAPQVPQRLDGGVLFARDEGLRVKAQDLAQLAQELGGRMQPDGRLQVGAVQRLAQLAAEFAVHADVGFGIGQLRHVGEVAAEREAHVHLGTDAFDKAADLGKVGGRVERAVDGADDVDARAFALLARLGRWHLLLLDAEFRPQPVQRAVGGLPLVLVDGARQEALDAGALRCHAAADHLGDGTGNDDARHGRVQRLVRPAHRALGAMLAQFLFRQAGDHDRQFMRRQRIGVMQHRGDRQVLAAHRAVDDHLQALDGREDVDRTPVAAGAVMIDHEHEGASVVSFVASCQRKLASRLVAATEAGPQPSLG